CAAAAIVIGARSFLGSNGRLGEAFGTTVNVELLMSSVCPSGADLETMSVPIVPAAPGRLSTTTCWCICSASFGPRIRAVMSLGLAPGGNGTTMRIGREGYASGLAGAAYATSGN